MPNTAGDLGGRVGPARWPGGGLHSIRNTTEASTGVSFSLGGGAALFGIQFDSTGVEAKLQGSLSGTNFTDIGATDAWSTSQGSGTLVQVKSSAPVSHARLVLNSNGSTGANGWFISLTSAST